MRASRAFCIASAITALLVIPAVLFDINMSEAVIASLYAFAASFMTAVIAPHQKN